MGALARQPSGHGVLRVGHGLPARAQGFARGAVAALANHRQRRRHGLGRDFNARRKAHGLGQQVFQNRHVHDPVQRRHALHGCGKAQLAVLVAAHMHLHHGRGVLRRGPAAQAGQQLLPGGVDGVGAHVRRFGRTLRRGRQRHAQFFTRQQKRQHTARNACAAYADVSLKCTHGGGF